MLGFQNLSLKTYNHVKVPNKKSIMRLRSFGKFLNTGASAPLGFSLSTILAQVFLEFSNGSEMLLLFAASLAIAFFMSSAGKTMFAHYSKEYNTYFSGVYQGIVVDRSTSGGGDTPLLWVVRIHGYTIAAELTASWQSVSADQWYKITVGDTIDLGLPEGI